MQRPTSRMTTGHLQPVQDDEIRRLNLPPSIPMSRDGEEGAVVYNLRLHQSNAEARTDCYQAPPNRTVDAAGAGGGLAGGLAGVQSPKHSTSTPSSSSSSLKQHGAHPLPLPPPLPPLLTRREVTASLATPRPPLGSKGHLKLTSPTHPRDDHRSVDAVDYPTGGGLLSRWRAASPDRLERTSNLIIPSAGLLSPPPLPVSPGGVWSEQEQLASAEGKRPKQRSSSADSVRRLVARCSFLRFAKKHAPPTVAKTTTMTSQSTMTLLVNPQKAFDDAGVGHSPDGEEREQEAPPWELPPNYVDMIFTKDPATIDDKKEKNVIKQQQQQQRQQQRQQRQMHHCCFNS